jgi:hypothetical protein
MWEDDPQYQNAQAKMIGIGLVLLFIASVTHCFFERDWHFLGQVLLFTTGFALFPVSLVGVVRIVARLLSSPRQRDSLDHKADI